MPLVGQLLVADVFKEGNIPCIRISDEGEHQKVKTEVSLRAVPIHAELLALGVLGLGGEPKGCWSQALILASQSRRYERAGELDHEGV